MTPYSTTPLVGWIIILLASLSAIIATLNGEFYMGVQHSCPIILYVMHFYKNVLSILSFSGCWSNGTHCQYSYSFISLFYTLTIIKPLG